jgi:hypothetical protein
MTPPNTVDSLAAGFAALPDRSGVAPWGLQPEERFRMQELALRREQPRLPARWERSPSDRTTVSTADSSGSMRNVAAQHIIQRSALESQKPRKSGAWPERGTQESNLALRFWRPH